MAKAGKSLAMLGVPITTLIGIVACFGDDAVGASINPALATIGAAFPEVPYAQIMWLYSMPKIVIVPLTLVSGLVVGRYISFRLAAILGFGLIAVGGVAPAVCNEFWQIMAFRFVLGVGLAIQAPIGPALVLRYFADPQKRAYVLGFGHGFVNVYGVVTNVLVGSLCAIDWHYAFLAYGTIFVLLVLAILFVREPPSAKGEVLSAKEVLSAQARADFVERNAGEGCDVDGELIAEPTVSKKSIWARLPKSAYCLIFLYLFTLVLWGVAGLNLSAVIQENGLGDAATAGIVVSTINLSGVISGFAFGFLMKHLKEYVLPFGYFLMALGFVVYYFAPNAVVLSFGVFVAGLANTILMTGFENAVGSKCDVSLIYFGMSLCMTMSQLSGFLCPFYITFVMDVMGFSSYSAPLLVSATVLVLLGGGRSLCYAFALCKRAVKNHGELAVLQAEASWHAWCCFHARVHGVRHAGIFGHVYPCVASDGGAVWCR